MIIFRQKNRRAFQISLADSDRIGLAPYDPDWFRTSTNACLKRAFPRQNYINGAKQYLEVIPQAAMTKIEKIVTNFSFETVDVVVVAVFDLRYAG